MPECSSAVSTCPHQEGPALTPEYTITVHCEHRAGLQFVREIGLVPTPGLTTLPYQDRLVIIYEGPDPPEVMTAEGTHAEDAHIEGGGGQFQALISIDPDEGFFGQLGQAGSPEELVRLTLIDAFKRIWTHNSKKHYALRGMPVSIPVTIYNPEQWKIKLSIPPARQTKVGAKYGTHRSAGDVEVFRQQNTHNHRTGESTSRNEVVSSDANRDIDESTNSERLYEGLTITRSGTPMRFDGMNAILALVSVVNIATELAKKIQDAVPRVGWYMEANMTVLDADLEVEWGWREHTDERAFYYVATRCRLNLIKVKLEFGFGYSGFGNEAQIFVSGEGGVPLTLNVARDSPDVVFTSVVGISGTVTFTVGARAKVGFIVSCEINASSSIVVNGEFKIQLSDRVEIGVGLDAGIAFTGVVGTMTWSLGAGGGFGGTRNGGGNTGSNSRTLMRGGDLYRWEWPKNPDELNSSKVNRDGFKRLLEQEVLNNIKYGREVKQKYGLSRWASNEDVAERASEEFASRFFRNNILRDEKSIKGLCSVIRARLERHYRWDHLVVRLYLEDWEDFMDREMPQLMRDMIDPMSEYQS